MMSPTRGGKKGEERKGAAPVPHVDDSTCDDVIIDNTNVTIASRS